MKGKYSKGLIVAIVILNALFTAGVLVVFWHTSSEPASLVAAWFAFTTGELWMLAGIKKKKIQKGEEDGDS